MAIITSYSTLQTAISTWLARKGVILRGGGLDKAPQAYRRLPDVIAAQGATDSASIADAVMRALLAATDDKGY